MKNFLTFLFILISSHLIAQTIQVTTLTDEIPASGGVKLDLAGNLYIANFGQGLGNADGNQIWKLDTAGNLTVFATGFQGASGNDFDSQGNLYQSNIAGDFISKITPDGQVSTFANMGFVSPVGIAIDSEDNLYVCNCGDNSIIKVTPDGTSSVFSSGTVFSCPNGIDLDHEENLYVSNFSNGDIIKITPDGTPSVFANIPGNNNGHLTYHPLDSIFYVNSHGSHQIYRMTLAQNVTAVVGSGVRGNLDGEGTVAQFSRPNGIALTPSGDTLYLNSSIPLTNGPEFPLNPSVVRMITGLNSLNVSAINSVWAYEGVEMSHFPNPVDTEATIQFDLPQTMDISIQLYSWDGRYIQTMAKGSYSAGQHSLDFKAQNLSTGLYVYTILHQDFQIARAMYVK